MRKLALAAATVMLWGCQPHHPPAATLGNAENTAATVGTGVGESRQTVEATAGTLTRAADSGSRAPTTQAAQPHWQTVSGAAKTLYGVAASLTQTEAAVCQLQSQLKTAHKQADQLESDLDASKRQIAAETTARKEAEAKWHDSWFGGKTWRLFAWVVGIGVTLVILDCVLFFFTNNWSLNPLTLLFGLLGRMLKPKPQTINNVGG